jgi:hypothetical protein
VTRLTQLSLGNRIVAGVLALVWIGTGLAAVALGLARRHWLPVLLGPLAVCYGALWVRVAQAGRQVDIPWRKRRS